MALRASYTGCPICAGPLGKPVGRFDCTAHPLFVDPLPRFLTWLRCGKCGHIHTDGYWTAEGLRIVLAKAPNGQVAGGNLDHKRSLWAPVVQAVLALRQQQYAFEGHVSWLDVGCGDGALVMTAAEFGLDAAGLDSRKRTVEELRLLGYKAFEGSFPDVPNTEAHDVLSMADVLEHLPYPAVALRKAHGLLKSRGLLFISCPNVDCASWRAMDAARANPYWIEIEHHHNFSRRLLMALLRDTGFRPAYYGINQRYKAGMDIIAAKTS